ncbi:MAG: GNAT family N-acetyltransferase [Thermodesulfobacteriota bacterium]
MRAYKETEGGITINLFRPGDAPGVAALFRAVYGEGYPVKYYYDPIQLNESVARQDTLVIVARTGEGEVAGAVSLFRSAPNPRIYEIGAGLVLPQYRNLGINARLFDFIFGGEEVRRRFSLDALWGEAVCNHLHLQKTQLRVGAVPMAVEVDLMPAEAYEKEQSATGRVASVAGFHIYRTQPHTIFLPAPYEDALRFLYEGFPDPRTYQTASEEPPGEGTRTLLAEHVFDFASVARVAANSVGRDFADAFSALDVRLQGKGTHLVQVWVKLTRPEAGWVTEQLRRKGYFLCGVLPRWFEEGDALLMAKTPGRPNWEGIQLYSDRIKRLFEFVRGDGERARLIS